MTIRSITVDDIASLAILHKASRRASEDGVIYPDDLDRESVEDFEKNWDTWLADEEIHALCLDDNGEIKGFVLYGRVKTRPSFDKGVVPRYGAEIYALYVDPNHFRKGIGKTLFKAACDDLIDRKLISMILWVLKKNKRACAFYDQYGGERIAKQRVDLGEKSWAEESCFGWRDLRKL